MKRNIIVVPLLIALAVCCNSKVAGTPINPPAPKHPHPVIRHGIMNRNSMVGRAQTAPAHGASIGAAAQTAAGGNSNPLLEKKKRSTQ